MAELEQVSSPLAFVKQKQKIDLDAQQELVNLYCQKDSEIAPLRASVKILEKDLKEVEDQLQASLDESNSPGDNGSIKTADWLLQFGYKGKTTEVLDPKALLKVLGEEIFFSIIEVKIGELKKYLTAPQLEQYTKEVNKYKRKLKYAPNV